MGFDFQFFLLFYIVLEGFCLGQFQELLCFFELVGQEENDKMENIGEVRQEEGVRVDGLAEFFQFSIYIFWLEIVIVALRIFGLVFIEYFLLRFFLIFRVQWSRGIDSFERGRVEVQILSEFRVGLWEYGFQRFGGEILGGSIGGVDL